MEAEDKIDDLRKELARLDASTARNLLHMFTDDEFRRRVQYRAKEGSTIALGARTLATTLLAIVCVARHARQIRIRTQRKRVCACPVCLPTGPSYETFADAGKSAKSKMSQIMTKIAQSIAAVLLPWNNSLRPQ